ncbi:MAG: hypothetical protein JST89_18470 [Cyanobacteria bacterium SZAS-4]|nr:hypothetical protein [Cyanobacteria bacterium SZAS-4]
MNPLNENQKLFLWVGILAIVAMGIYPPWKLVDETPTSFAFLYAPPPGQVKLDYSRLVVEWCLAGFVTAGLIATAQTAAAKNSSANASTNAKASTTQEPPQVAPAKSNSKTTSSVATKSIKFPDTSLGEVLVESADDPDYWEGLGEARGTVKIPSGRNVQLEVHKEKPMNLAGLKEMDPHSLQSIDFSESEVEDDDIQYLLHFSKLYEIDLSHTSISDEGIEQLAKLYSLKKIWLDNTKITDAALEKLKGLQGLTKVSLTGTDIAESSIRELKDAFPKNCEIIMASGIPA